jgi:phytoene synthase
VARDTSFSYSFLVLPDDQRRAIGVVWDFCRAVDDAVDEAVDRPTAEAAVASWRREIDGLFGPMAPQTPQAIRLKPYVAMFELSRAPFDDLVDGVEMDLRQSRYETFDELIGYCRRVASAVGLICIEIFGCRDSRSRDYAFNLGLALQLTNIIRDAVTAEIRRLLQHESQRARHFFTAARQAMPPHEARKLVAAEIMGAIYYDILQRIEHRGFDVFGDVIRVPKIVRARIALAIWARSQLSAIGLRRSARA